MSEIILNLPSEKATSEFGKKISENLKIGDIIYLSGEMGSGKTTLARSIIIDIVATTTENEAIIEIKDQGPGIPKENLGRIFERFYTFRPEEKTFGNNSGLGLSICKQIIKSLNGTIIATNALEGGAVFTITLPLSKNRKERK